MKAEFDFDTKQLVDEISAKVIKAMKSIQRKGRTEDDIIFTVKTLAKYLEVSDQWVYERISRNEIPHIKVGKFPRFKKFDIDRWLDGMKIPVVNDCSRNIKGK